VNCFFKNNSSQVASADVLEKKKFCRFVSDSYGVHWSRMHYLLWPTSSNSSRDATFARRSVRCRSSRAVFLARRVFALLPEYGA
jgi:hypothetical protein